MIRNAAFIALALLAGALSATVLLAEEPRQTAKATDKGAAEGETVGAAGAQESKPDDEPKGEEKKPAEEKKPEDEKKGESEKKGDESKKDEAEKKDGEKSREDRIKERLREQRSRERGRGGDSSRRGRGEGRSSRGAPSGPARSLKKRDENDPYAVIADRDMFKILTDFDDPKPPPAPVQRDDTPRETRPSGPPPEPKLTLRVSGIFREGEKLTALIQNDRDGTVAFVSSGDAIGNRVVRALEPEKIVLADPTDAAAKPIELAIGGTFEDLQKALKDALDKPAGALAASMDSEEIKSLKERLRARRQAQLGETDGDEAGEGEKTAGAEPKPEPEAKPEPPAEPEDEATMSLKERLRARRERQLRERDGSD